MALSLRLARGVRISSSFPSAALRPAAFLCQHCRLSSSSSSSPSLLPTAFSARKFSTSAVSSFSSSTSNRSTPPTTTSPSSSSSLSTQADDAAPLSDSQYHELADEYLEDLVGRLEELQDEREDVDVEYSQGVLTLEIGGSGSENRRTYVINKQPPNRQIWLSSPISGPKRYDWRHKERGDLGADTEESSSSSPGHWIYLKDGSLLDDLIREEIGLDLDERGPREDDI